MVVWCVVYNICIACYELHYEQQDPINEVGSSLISVISRVSPSQEQHLPAFILKFRHRPFHAYEKFSSALRAAEQRVPRDIINSWITKDTVGKECTVCMCEIDGDEVCLRLPCGHTFHEDCIKSWLHWNCECPNCRHSLSVDV
eukprot:m.71691 g.71691  ORF g.71691 m.71691 type:complete len:143 (+) comp12270_c0_seq4:1230-1658(+)